MPTNERTISICCNNTMTLRFDIDTSALGPAYDLSTYSATWWLGVQAYHGPGPTRDAIQLVRKSGNSAILIPEDGGWALFVKIEPDDTAEVKPGLYHQEAAVSGPNGEFYTVTLGDVRLTETEIR